MSICGKTTVVELIDVPLDEDDMQMVHCSLPAGHDEAHSGLVLWTNRTEGEIADHGR